MLMVTLYFCNKMNISMNELSMMMLTIIVFVFAWIINLSQGSSITFNTNLVHPDLKLDCKYKLNQGESFDYLKLQKDGETFLHFTRDNRDGMLLACSCKFQKKS